MSWFNEATDKDDDENDNDVDDESDHHETTPFELANDENTKMKNVASKSASKAPLFKLIPKINMKSRTPLKTDAASPPIPAYKKVR